MDDATTQSLQAGEMDGKHLLEVVVTKQIMERTLDVRVGEMSPAGKPSSSVTLVEAHLPVDKLVLTPQKTNLPAPMSLPPQCHIFSPSH